MIKTKQFKSLIALLLAALMMVSAAACGMNNDSKDGSKGKKTEAQSSMTDGEPKSPEEAAAMYKKLMEEEKAILDENPALWEKVFMAADKGMVLIEDGKNYGEFLLDTIESAKDQFTADELKLLKADAEKIRAIEMKLTKLVNKYPELSDKDGNGGANMPEESAVPSDKPSSGNKGGSGNTDKPSSGNKGGSGNTDKPSSGNKDSSGSTGSTGNTGKPSDNSGNTGKPSSGNTGSTPTASPRQKFPSFSGKDLNGNSVTSGSLFSGNSVTVVNFWFTTCGPCVGELGELDALNKKLAQKGGAVVGINAFTLDGDEAAIADAKAVLAKKGATYKNIYFDSGSAAGKFTNGIYAFPTTYVIDRNGGIVGEPIVGAITSKAQMDALQKLIDTALAG